MNDGSLPCVLSLLAVLLLAGVPPAVSPREAPPLWGRLVPGAHSVGFTVLGRRDETRKRSDGSARPVQVSLWYPASPAPVAKTSAAMTYADYVGVSTAESTLADPSPQEREAALTQYRGFLSSQGLSEAGVSSWMDARLLARRDAPPAPVAFPLVLVAQGNGGALHDQAILAELLASHGYVVATTPSPVRLGDTLAGDSDILPVAEAQAKDLAFALALLRKDRRVDARRVAVIGYSFGARAALLLAAREPVVKALVSLDGGIGTATGGDWLGDKAKDRARFATPILHVYEETESFMVPDFALLDSLTASEQLRVKVEALRHYDLITLGFAKAALPALGAAPDDAAALTERLAAAFTYALRFVQAHVSGQAAAREFLARAPAESAPATRLTVTRKPGRATARRPAPRT